MIQDIKTIELAKIYEGQGYYKDALEIFSFIDKEQACDEAKSGLDRINKKIKARSMDTELNKETLKREKIFILFEKWFNLMILDHRLNSVQLCRANTCNKLFKK